MKLNMALWRIIGLLMLIGTTGCGTVTAHTMPPPEYLPANSGVYRGTKFDVHLLSSAAKSRDAETKAYAMVFGPFWVCDVPLSIVADTLILPFDALSGHGEVMDQLPAPDCNL